MLARSQEAALEGPPSSVGRGRDEVRVIPKSHTAGWQGVALLFVLREVN